jgi:hypothetical protein
VAVVVQLTWEGVTPEQYDEARDKVGWETDLANGGIFHVSSFERGALHACDVCEPTVVVHGAHRYLDTAHGEARS